MLLNLYDYIDKYKNYTFQDKDLTDVDAMLFSFLAYANFEEILLRSDALTIHEVARRHIITYTKKDMDILAVRQANKLLRYIKDTKRYQDCILSNYERIETDVVQFSAITIEYRKNHLFVAFEGTNAAFSGWIEDLLLSCEFPTMSHTLAIRYLNNHFTFSFKELIIGGHSKGGNLALVSSMYANSIVRRKIHWIYNGDGPGLLDEEYHSKRYQSILNKYTHFIPDYGVVGILLNHDSDVIVKSKMKNILSHDVLYWEIQEDTFEKTTLSPFSKELDIEIARWVRNTPISQKRELITNLEIVLRTANVDSLLDLKTNYLKVFSIIFNSNKMSNSSKNTLSNFIKILLKCFDKARKEEVQLFLNHIFKKDNKESREDD